MAGTTFNIKVIGADRVDRILKQYGGGAAIDVTGALVEEGNKLLRDVKERFVPVDAGTLRASGFVRGPRTLGNRTVVEIGFGGPAAPYALKVHENPRSGKTGGVNPDGSKRKSFAATGQWKYLTTPFKQRKAGLSRRIATRVGRRVKARRR